MSNFVPPTSQRVGVPAFSRTSACEVAPKSDLIAIGAWPSVMPLWAVMAVVHGHGMAALIEL